MSEFWQTHDFNTSGRYTVAAICRHGHVITGDAQTNRMALTKFCAKCGGEVLTSCMGCDAPIQGHYVPPGVSAVGGRLVPPGFCSTCGKPHPWTEEKIAAARELTDELVDLSIEDRDQLKTAIEQVATDGPRAEAAAARIKRLIGKASSAVGQAIWKITVDVASEAAKKILTGT